MSTQSMQQLWDSSLLDGGNSAFLEEQYESYLKDQDSVSPEWQAYFANLPKTNGQMSDESHHAIKQFFIDYAKHPKRYASSTSVSASSSDIEHERRQTQVLALITEYRLHGHMNADIDPLGLRKRCVVKELEVSNYSFRQEDFDQPFDAGSLVGGHQRTLKQIIDDLNKVYCGPAAAEFMHIAETNERQWIQKKYESIFLNDEINVDEKKHILEGLTAAEGLEKYLGSKYPGAKRFGLEGCDSLIVALDMITQHSGALGAQEVIIGMAHRGRLNVLVNILGKNPSDLFDEFEGKHYSKEIESGDVKYHQGFSSDIETPGGYMHLSLAFNPSHLEIVAPVVCGSVRARQERRVTHGAEKVFAVNIHGDSAFAGQGVVMETLNMSQTRGYTIGGSIHIVTNNQVGFTTSRIDDTRSTLYCSDVGKMLQAPIFHVNADDPEAVYAISRLAVEYRAKFHKDVIIDLVGYRRNGHNEADEPKVTQPKMYSVIRSRPTARKIYADKLIQNKTITPEEADAFVETYRKALDDRDKAVARRLVTGWENEFASDWSSYAVTDWRIETKTAVSLETIASLADKRDTLPEGFSLHARVKKIFEDRRKMTAGELPIDWGYAETLAYATLIHEGHPVRLSGQDCGRGTFFHRHVAAHDQNTGEAYISLKHLDEQQASFTVIDSLLSEAAVLGFEYGFSTSEPRSLVIWEAQFGDFANSAQVVIDQFISSGEHKWGRLSGLTMLLPHGYEGQGPEHSSARLERYMQLCAEHNIQVCIPSTPAQVFHMLRRQVLRHMRKPLIVMSPKSLLRHKSAVSSLQELTDGAFKAIIGEVAELATETIKRIVLCSGKIYYELVEKRQAMGRDDVAIIRIEQMYPFPEIELRAELQQYPQVKDVVWCQEEPLNQGVWFSSQHHMRACLLEGQQLIYAGREGSAAPAVGYAHLHKEQQEQVVKDALG